MVSDALLSSAILEVSIYSTVTDRLSFRANISEEEVIGKTAVVGMIVTYGDAMCRRAAFKCLLGLHYFFGCDRLL